MTPADDRIIHLLQKWQTSLDLHARYAGLSEDQYWLVQPWPQHQRPTKWVIDLARQRVADLARIFQNRIAAGDPSLGEALELMSFLANLVGVQSVERFIPMAEPERERPLASITIEVPALSTPPAGGPVAPTVPLTQQTPTRGAPNLADKLPEAGRAPRHDHGQSHDRPRQARSRPAAPVTDDPRAQEVVNDAIRLLSWGREWHELPDAIARMAGRPDAGRVREILRTHRAEIDRAGGAAAPTGTQNPARTVRLETRKQ
jgi:hypothetical protein